MRISPISLIKNYRQNFKATYPKENNIAILGSSKTTDSIIDSLVICSEVVRYSVVSGKNILTGCGNRGVMGQAYYTALAFSKKDENGKPEQNIVILKDPLWGDEDLENCIVLGKANSEATRIEKFMENADKFVIFPGGPGTIQEASTLIANNYYNKENSKQIILVGKKHFEGLDMQYQKMYEEGLIKCLPSELYTITDEKYEILDMLGCL